jgi:MoaA/NifB/PqqE/SkfB family radical SAM enzyme
MKMGLYADIIKSIAEFPDRLKMLSLFIKGEPLLNPKLPEMVALAKSQKVAQKIYITTNGALFSPGLNRKLVQAGIDEILVSIEAVDSDEYKKITGVDIDFDELVANIKDFYQNKGECNFFIKIVTYTQDHKRVRRFHEIFDPICDFAYMEQVVPIFDRVDYDTIALDRSRLSTIYRPIHVCTRPFFNMCVHTTGDIGACLVDYIPEVCFGNVAHDGLYDVWRGKTFTDFRLMQLHKKRYQHFKCGPCVSPQYDTQDSDFLDDEAERLIKLFKAQT